MGKGRPDKIPKKMFRWNHQRDLSLVTAVEAYLPFLASTDEANEIWNKISEEINQIYQGNCNKMGVTRRFKLLLSDFKSEDFKNRYKSGTEEDVTAIVEKLAAISSLIDDAKLEKVAEEAEKTKKLNEEKAIGEELRGAAMSSLKRKPTGDAENVTPKRLSDKSLSDMWYEKQLADQRIADEQKQLERERHADEILEREKDRELRRKELELKEKELEIERAKINHQQTMEKEEQKLQRERFEVEREERATMLTTQKIMLEMLQKQLN